MLEGAKKLCEVLLMTYFSEMAGFVGRTLIGSTGMTVNEIMEITGLEIFQVNVGLGELKRVNCLGFKLTAPDTSPSYFLKEYDLLSIVQQPHYVRITQEEFGVGAAFMVETLLNEGVTEASKLVVKVVQAHPNTTGSTDLLYLRKLVLNLIDQQYLIRCPTPSLTEGNYVVAEDELFKKPDIYVSGLRMRIRNEEGCCGDESIYWWINRSKFHQIMRNELVAVMEGFCYFKTDPFENFYPEIALVKGHAEPENCDMSCAAWLTAIQVVKELFGERTASVFRVIYRQPYIDINKVKSISPLSGTETKMHLMKLINEKIIHKRKVGLYLCQYSYGRCDDVAIHFKKTANILLEKCYLSICEKINSYNEQRFSPGSWESGKDIAKSFGYYIGQHAGGVDANFPFNGIRVEMAAFILEEYLNMVEFE